MNFIRSIKANILRNKYLSLFSNENSTDAIDLSFAFNELQKIQTFLQDYDQLVYWLRFKAGSSNKKYFNTKFQGGFKLQQIPEEYAELLFFLKQFKPSHYLEIGLGNGGSWLFNSYFLRSTLEVSHSVDNLSYGNLINQRKSDVKDIETYLREYISDVKFFHSDSKSFLNNCETKYDIIFIDGDHSYAGVKSDYILATKCLKENGIIIFHDIASKSSPGVIKIWNEVKSTHRNYKEFIHGKNCGIGVLYEMNVNN